MGESQSITATHGRQSNPHTWKTEQVCMHGMLRRLAHGDGWWVPTKDCADTRPRRAVKPPPSPAAGGLWGFGARAPARTHDKAPRRAVKPPPSPAAGANSRARPTPNLGWRTCGAMGAAHAPRSAWTVQVRSGETPRSPGPAARATDLRAAGPRAHARAHSAALGGHGACNRHPSTGRAIEGEPLAFPSPTDPWGACGLGPQNTWARLG